MGLSDLYGGVKPVVGDGTGVLTWLRVRIVGRMSPQIRSSALNAGLKSKAAALLVARLR